MRIHRKLWLPLLLVAVLIVGISVAALVAAQDTPSAPDTAETEDEAGEAEGPASASDARLTEDEAIAIAEAERGSTAVATELENEGGITLYSIELADGSEVEVDANTGAILQVEGAEGDDD